MRSLPADRRAAALLVVLWMVTILALLVMGLAMTMQVETRVASHHRLQFKCDILARAGIELARQQLMEDLDPSKQTDADGFKEAWCTNPDLYENHVLGEGLFHVRVIPEDGKLNINTLAESPEALRYLFELLLVPSQDIDVLVDSIDDWVDLDSLTRPNGAESDFYAQREPPYRPKNGPMDRLEELLLVQGMTRELFHGRETGKPLKEFLTTLSSGKINVNVSPPFVLAIVLGLDEGQAQAVVEYRNGEDGIQGTEDDRIMTSIQDLLIAANTLSEQELSALKNVLDFKSYFFTILSEGRVGNVSKLVRVTVSRDAEGTKILSWLEGSDALK